MKIKDGFMLREVAGNYIVVAVGNAVKEFNGMINLNETGALMWKVLEKGGDEQDILTAMLNEYEVDEQTAKADIKEFVENLVKAGLLK